MILVFINFIVICVFFVDLNEPLIKLTNQVHPSIRLTQDLEETAPQLRRPPSYTFLELFSQDNMNNNVNISSNDSAQDLDVSEEQEIEEQKHKQNQLLKSNNKRKINKQTIIDSPKRIKTIEFNENHSQLIDLYNQLKLTPIIPTIDNIDVITDDESVIIQNELLNDSTNKIVLLLENELLLMTDSNKNNNVRKSRRKSLVDIGLTWIIVDIIRLANINERNLGFTHLISYKLLNNNETKEKLVSLYIFGYYNMNEGKILKELKYTIPLQTWIALK